ncbi:hypothetical protein [Lacisediminihabitans profunda]|uniref:Uncharacterized protein n=1 Tax=Lacisediminihabitans profunda TaxID=2594790 RepID=A0A5C8UIT7_9MICO|nr:hypothetical protein [Lacisediminihabitans profunda]TXN28087.1 hypothetical protein FVP33_18230 [Lacisediminihabitans profunda]
MQWWNDFLGWLSSDDGARIISSAVIPFLAILIAGVVAAAIGRGSAKRVIALSDREVKASAVTALISAARKAAVWNTLPAPEQQHIDHLIGDADIRLRLLPVPGTALAADWASHEIISMKRNAVSFSFQAEQSLLVFRDRLIEWQARPSRAKRLFKNDLDSWAYDSSLSEQELVHNQQAWAAAQVAKTGPVDTVSAAAIAAPTVAAAATPPVATPPVATPPVTRPFAQSRFSRPAAVPVAPSEATHDPAVSEPTAARTPEPTPAAAEPDAPEAETVEPEIVEPESHQPAQTEHLEEIVVDDDEQDEDLPELVEPAPEEPRDVSQASVFAPADRNDHDGHDRQEHEHHQHN